MPCCLPVDDRHVAILYSVRDAANRSRPARVVLDIKTLKLVGDVAEPLLELGAPGTFDDSGVMPTWVVSSLEGFLVYYVGWNRAVTVPFQNAIGAAWADLEGRKWSRVSEGPLVTRSRRDPYFVASCAVVEDGARWRMWYLSCQGWVERAGVMTHRYHIRQMMSDHPLDWPNASTPAIDFASPDEYAISRPSVLRHDGRWHMWYSTRGHAYRIGYAVSDNGETWRRQDDIVGIGRSPSGWDSEMICYPHVFTMNGTTYMAYNGNGYGASGIGLAVISGPGW